MREGRPRRQSRSPAPTGPLPPPCRTRPPRLRRPRHPDSRPRQHTTRPGSRQRSGNISENSSDSLVALVDHARAERPGLDEVERNVLGDRRQERRAAADEDRVAKDAQLVNEAELDRCRGEAGAADLDVLVGRLERRGDLFGEWRLGEAGVALNAVERAAEDDLRERAPGVGERGRVLVVLQRRIRLPREHRLVEPAAQQAAPELVDLLEVEAKLLVARDAPFERAVAVGDEAVHRDAHRVDQHGFTVTGQRAPVSSGISSSCMTAPPCFGCLPEGLYGRRTPLPPSIRLSPWGVRIAGRFLASAVLRSGRALRRYWRGLRRSSFVALCRALRQSVAFHPIVTSSMHQAALRQSSKYGGGGGLLLGVIPFAACF